jgi:FkbM family methyltransferase
MKMAPNTGRGKRAGVKVLWTVRLALSIGVLTAYTLLTHLSRNKSIGRELAGSSSGSRRRGLVWLIEELSFVVISRLKVPFAYWDERYVSKLLRNVRGGVFLDVGADRGYYSVLLSDNFHVIYAIEPARENVQTMQRLFRRVPARPLIIEAAVTDHDGSATLVKGRDHARHHLQNLPKRGDSLRSTYTVPSVSLDSLVKAFGNVDLVKVDVEGAEWLVLKGADSQAGKISRWLVEVHTMSRKDELESWMRNHQYEFAWIDKDHLYAWKPELVNQLDGDVQTE